MTKPIEKPPSVADSSRFMPPTTTPASTTIVSRRAKSGVTSGFWTVRMTLTVAASSAGDEHGRADHAVRVDTQQARGPEVHRRRPHVQPDGRALEQSTTQTRQTAATTIATIVILRMSTLPIVTGRFR